MLRFDWVLPLDEPHDWCFVTKYEYTSPRSPCYLDRSVVGVKKKSVRSPKLASWLLWISCNCLLQSLSNSFHSNWWNRYSLLPGDTGSKYNFRFDTCFKYSKILYTACRFPNLGRAKCDDNSDISNNMSTRPILTAHRCIPIKYLYICTPYMLRLWLTSLIGLYLVLIGTALFGSLMSCFDSVDSRLVTVTLTYYSGNIDQHLVPPCVSTCSRNDPM